MIMKFLELLKKRHHLSLNMQPLKPVIIVVGKEKNSLSKFYLYIKKNLSIKKKF